MDQKGEAMDKIKVGSLTLTREEARRAGLLPEQQRERARRSLTVLARYGQDKGAFARALRKVAR